MWKLNLLEDNVVEAKFCADASECTDEKVSGNWSTVYDQMLNVNLENGLRFITNFKYTIKPDISEDPLNDDGQKI